MSFKTKYKPAFKPEISFEVCLQKQVEQATVLHCQLTHATSIRIWSNTILVQKDGNRKSLIEAYNIPEYPIWKYVSAGYIFTLVFEGLDKDCKSFDLIEEIPEPGGFVVMDIPRNHLDVYRITF